MWLRERNLQNPQVEGTLCEVLQALPCDVAQENVGCGTSEGAAFSTYFLGDKTDEWPENHGKSPMSSGKSGKSSEVPMFAGNLWQ